MRVVITRTGIKSSPSDSQRTRNVAASSGISRTARAIAGGVAVTVTGFGTGMEGIHAGPNTPSGSIASNTAVRMSYSLVISANT
jgi:hypothetical protein